MRLKDIIRAPKNVRDWGEWKDAPSPRSAFPVRKSGNSARARGSYRWRVILFSALGMEFRIFCQFHAGKEQFYVWLGEQCARDIRMIVAWEFHGTHPGWHVHSACGELSEIPEGRVRGPSYKRIASSNERFGVTEQNAVDEIAKKFGLYNGGESLWN